MSKTKEQHVANEALASNKMVFAPEIANFLGISLHAFYRLVRDGDFAAPVLLHGKGSTQRWRACKVIEWVEAKEKEAADEIASVTAKKAKPLKRDGRKIYNDDGSLISIVGYRDALL